MRPDGVFAIPAPDEERASFIALPPPARVDVEALLARLVVRVLRCVEKHFAGRADELAIEVMDVLASDSMRAAAGIAASSDKRASGRFEAFLDGCSLHCGVHLHENDRWSGLR